MRIESVLPKSVRSRYALKLLDVSLLIVLVITEIQGESLALQRGDESDVICRNHQT
jgi:hypothetical protein